jgi:hypothetical protein
VFTREQLGKVLFSGRFPDLLTAGKGLREPEAPVVREPADPDALPACEEADAEVLRPLPEI